VFTPSLKGALFFCFQLNYFVKKLFFNPFRAGKRKKESYTIPKIVFTPSLKGALFFYSYFLLFFIDKKVTKKSSLMIFFCKIGLFFCLAPAGPIAKNVH